MNNLAPMQYCPVRGTRYVKSATGGDIAVTICSKA